jgi:hypothetical protein
MPVDTSRSGRRAPAIGEAGAGGGMGWDDFGGPPGGGVLTGTVTTTITGGDGSRRKKKKKEEPGCCTILRKRVFRVLGWPDADEDELSSPVTSPQ